MHPLTRRSLAVATLTAALALAPGDVPAAEAKVLRLLSAWPENMAFVEGCYTAFARNLEKASGGALSVQFSGPDAVPTVEQFQPVQSGVFDLLLTIAPYHMGTTAVGAALDATDADPARRRESGIFAYADRHYQTLGMKLVAVLPVADMNFLTRVPVDGNSPSFRGLKLRTIQTVAPLVEALGGAPVNMAAGEVYTSLQKGVIDGAVVITYGAQELKWHEVTRHMVRPSFGYISTLLFMNRDKYDALSPGEREAVDRAGVQAELDAVAYFREKREAEVGFLKSRGLQESRMGAEDAARVEQIYRDTIWKIAEEKSGQAARDLHELARTKGMTR